MADTLGTASRSGHPDHVHFTPGPAAFAVFRTWNAAGSIGVVIRASVVAEIPLGTLRLAVRIGPRRKWVQSTAHPDEDDPQPGFGGELVLSRPLR